MQQLEHLCRKFSTMITYSVTVSVASDIKDEWIEYMKNEHIPDVMKTECFTGFKFSRVIGTSEEKENSYNIQYFCNSMKDMHKYQVNHALQLQKHHVAKYGEKALAFRTLLEDI